LTDSINLLEHEKNRSKCYAINKGKLRHPKQLLTMHKLLLKTQKLLLRMLMMLLFLLELELCSVH